MKGAFKIRHFISFQWERLATRRLPAAGALLSTKTNRLALFPLYVPTGWSLWEIHPNPLPRSTHVKAIGFLFEIVFVYVGLRTVGVFVIFFRNDDKLRKWQLFYIQCWSGSLRPYVAELVCHGYERKFVVQANKLW